MKHKPASNLHGIRKFAGKLDRNDIECNANALLIDARQQLFSPRDLVLTSRK
jgi:hypothetical protein